MSKATVNNIELYYETAGSGESVLFIHGLGSSARDWEMQIPAFTKQFKTTAFDLRGHGQSQKPKGPYSMSLFAKDTAELIRSLGVGSVHVVGISLGGMIAFQLAVDHPELVKSMVIVNSGPELVVRTLKERWLAVFEAHYAALCDEVDRGEEPLLDPYATESLEEFFAVASETFFVAPIELRTEHPVLYTELVGFYRQNPASRFDAD